MSTEAQALPQKITIFKSIAPIRLLDKDFEEGETPLETTQFRKRHNIGLAEEGNLYDCG